MSNKQTDFTLNIKGNIDDLSSKLSVIKKDFGNLLNSVDGKGAQSAFTKIESMLDSLRAKANTPIKTEGAFSSMLANIGKTQVEIEKLQNIISDFQKLSTKEKLEILPAEQTKDIRAANDALKKYSDTVKSLVQDSKAYQNAKKEELRITRDLEKKQAAMNVAQNRVTDARRSAGGAKANVTKLSNQLSDAQAAKDNEAIAKYTQAVERATKNYEKYEAIIKQAEKVFETTNKRYEETNELLKIQKEKLDDINTAFEADKSQKIQKDWGELREKAEAIGVSLDDIEVEPTEQSFEELTKRLNECTEFGVKELTKELDPLSEQLAQTAISTDNLRTKTEESAEAFKKENEAAAQVQGLVSRIKQFTGLAGAGLAARKILSGAISTIKELDKQMTEMAVVTNMDVGDYWRQLPEYTKRANELGVSIKSAYEAATLYYQQGLKTNEVVEISNSTLKMARIAGLNAAEATDRMTAALRGFNMEITQTNADRVADVYSKLAAITASNVDEISTAMTKTASIASSAHMEFETTAAFLSQIIETTRESAETAGTALKTVIARFQELKKSPDEIGEVDGEIIDANKIETALRSVDVALRDTNGQFRDLDDVFMELASKWDSLDTNTQRYIATIAAGSRQQSRFIAMMSNYNRTAELVTAANNAAGTSNEQFAKTMESLESKVARLKNSWDTFTMSIANSTLIKTGIDLLNKFLTVINKISQGWDEFSGGAIKIGLITAALSLGSKAVKIFLDSFGQTHSIMGSVGAVFVNFKNALVKGFTDIGKAQNAYTASSIKTNLAIKAAAQKRMAVDVKLKNNAINAAQAEKLKNSIMNQTKTTIQTNNKELAKKYMVENKLNNLTEQEIANTAVSAEQELFKQSLVAQGITEETAELAIKKGLTQEVLDNTKAQMLNVGATEAEVAASTQDTAATFAQTTAEEANNTTKKKGIGLGLKAIVMKIGHSIATAAQTVNQWALNIAESVGISLTAAYILMIIAFIAVVAIVTVAILALCGVFDKEGKELKKAKKGYEEATKAADEAKEAYDNLKESLENLQDKYNTLDELVTGTQEWRDAMLEVNDAVMNLIEKYPELAGYTELDSNGVLRISEEGQTVALEKARKVAAETQASKAAAKIRLNNAQNAVDLTKLIYNNRGAGGTIDRQGISQLSQEYANGELLDEDKFKSRFKELINEDSLNYLKSQYGEGINFNNVIESWADSLWDNRDDLREFGNSLNETRKQNEALYQSMATAAVSMIDLSKYTQEEQSTVTTLISGDFMQSLQDDIAKQYAGQGKKDLGGNEDIQKWAQETYGKDNVKIKNGKIQRKNDEGKWEDIDSKEIITAYSAAKASDQAATMDAQAIKLAERNATAAKALRDKSGKSLTRAEIAQNKNQTLRQVGNEVAGSIEETLYNTANKQYKETISNAENAFKKITENWGNKFGESTEKITTTFESNTQMLTLGAAEGLGSQMEQIFAVSGEEGASKFIESFGNLTKNYTDKQIETITSQLNAADWKSIESIDEVKETLYELGIVGSDSLDKLIADAKIFAGAVNTISMKQLKNRTQSATNLAMKIQSGEQGRTFSESDYQSVIAENKKLISQFIQLEDGSFMYLGGSMNSLREAIVKNTDAIIGSKTEQVIAQKQLAEYIQQVRISSTTDPLTYLRMLQNSKQVNIDQLGISNFSSKTDLDKLDASKLATIMTELQTKSAQAQSDIQEAIQTIALSYRKLDAGDLVDKFKLSVQAGKRDEASMIAGAGAFNTILSKAQENYMDPQLIKDFTEAYDNLRNGGNYNDFEAAVDNFFTQFEEVMNNYIPQFGMAYQLEQKISQLTTRRNKLEEEYEDLLESEVINANMLRDNLNERKSLLINENELLEAQAEQTETDIAQKIASYGYIGELITRQEDGTYKAKSGISREYEEAVQTALEDINSNAELLGSISDSINKNNRELKKLQKAGQDEYNDALSQVRDALINERQQEIDQLSAINDAINEAQSQLLSKLQEQIDDERQARDNADKEDAILDKQARLQELMAEGGSATEILALQKEIDDAEREYQDSLIDQELSSMESANQAAADQRQQQIDIATAQLEYWQNNQSWRKAAELLQSYYSASSDDVKSVLETRIGELLKPADYKAMTIEQQQGWTTDINNMLAQGEAYYKENLDPVMMAAKAWAEAAKDSADAASSQSITNYTAVTELTKELTTEEKQTTEWQNATKVAQESIDTNVQSIADQNNKIGDVNSDKKAIIESNNLDADSIRSMSDLETISNNYKQVSTFGIGSGDNRIDAEDDIAKNVATNLKMRYLERAGLTEGALTDDQISSYTANDIRAKKTAVTTAQTQDILSTEEAEAYNEKLDSRYLHSGQMVSCGKTASNNGKSVRGGNRIYTFTATYKDANGQDKEVSFETKKGENAWPVPEDNNTFKTISEAKGWNYGQLFVDDYGWAVIDGTHLGDVTDEHKIIRINGDTVDEWVKQAIIGTVFDMRSHYLHGGLADFTGPAWMDGTESAPELVLNAQDTKNFLMLKDVLADVMKGIAGTNNTSDNLSNGDAYIDIDINVDSLTSDYDVDEVARHVEELISEDARYRNVINAKTSR